MKSPREFQELFAKTHVVPGFQERFVHEAIKKQGKLQSRICLTIQEVFFDKYRDCPMPFEATDICIPITGTGVESFEEYQWSQVEQQALRGLGLLVASPDCTRFYAETEVDYGSPAVSYSSKTK